MMLELYLKGIVFTHLIGWNDPEPDEDKESVVVRKFDSICRPQIFEDACKSKTPNCKKSSDMIKKFSLYFVTTFPTYLSRYRIQKPSSRYPGGPQYDKMRD
jgi:hypothetical protein